MSVKRAGYLEKSAGVTTLDSVAATLAVPCSGWKMAVIQFEHVSTPTGTMTFQGRSALVAASVFGNLDVLLGSSMSSFAGATITNPASGVIYRVPIDGLDYFRLNISAITGSYKVSFRLTEGF